MQVNYDLESEIVISGISGRFPNSSNLDEFWQNLISGKDMVSDVVDRYNVEEFGIPSRLGTLKDLDKFDAEFFSVHGKQAQALDPRIRFMLEIAYEAILDAGIHPSTIQGSQTGVFVAGTESESQAIWKRSGVKLNEYGVLGNVLSMLANRVSWTFDFHGPSYVIDTACSTSSVALQQALNSIRTGQCEAAIVAGVHVQNDPYSSTCFHHLKMTSPDGKCKSFDASADGYVRAEAAVAIYICKKQVAKRAYATLVHAVTNSDGYTPQGITYPSEVQQERVIRQVYKECGVNPLDVGYIEAHGTGTKVGDPEELLALTKVFCEGREGPLLVGSVKSNMGHPEPVAGLCGIAKLILSNAAGVIPGNLHFKTPNPEIPALIDGRIQVVDRTQPFHAKYVGVNSMGFGGTNVHVLLKLYPTEEPESEWKPSVPLILLCSGRTQEAVETFLGKALHSWQKRSFVALVHDIYKHDTVKHDFRGYVVVEPQKMEIQVEKREHGRPVWFVFTGLGSQWPGMAKDLVRFETFRKSIERSARVLLNKNFDMLSLLKCGDPKEFEDFKNSVVSITTVQVALVDLLMSMGILPDGIIGHSTGEVAAGYADGCLTQEQALLVSFARVTATLESNLPPGTVASVGLTWEDAKQRIPQGVYRAIHNAKENVTIAGPPDVVKSFVKQLESEGIFARMVRSAAFGFHSPLVEGTAQLIKHLVEQIIPEPKIRSKKWLSSSVPEDQWGSDLAKYCSADYFVNNGVKPVYFYPTLLHLPENAIALEIAPHCFMQAILTKSLHKNAVKLGLIHVKSPDNCKYFLDSIGKFYLAGGSVDVAALYESPTFPVPPATPRISSMIRWDHSAAYNVPIHEDENSQKRGIKFTQDLTSVQEAFLEGHSIDGKILYPATGYLWIVWRFFAQHQGSWLDKHPVVFENVRFERITLMSKRSPTEFLINIFPTSGKFEISESDMLVCSGIIRNVEESASNEMLSYTNFNVHDSSDMSMCKEDFYKEMHLRGYGHSGLFQGIQEADMQGKWAKVKWEGEWISFLDAVIQSFLLRNESRDLYVPIRLQKLTVDPIEVKKHLEANDNTTMVNCWEVLKSGTCPGMEVRGLNFAKFNQRSHQPVPALVEQVFLPYLMQSPALLSETRALESSLEIAIENSSCSRFLFAEILNDQENMISHTVIALCSLAFAAYEFRLVNESGDAPDDEKLAAAAVKVLSRQDLQSRELNHVVFVDDEAQVPAAAEFVVTGGFVLCKGASERVIVPANMELVSSKCFVNDKEETISYRLFRKSSPVPENVHVVSTDVEGFSWVDVAKRVLQEASEIGRIYFVSQNPTSGIIGFVKCLVREATSEKIRCFHALDQIHMDFIHPSDALHAQIKSDLVFNVYRDKTWGALSNLGISKAGFQQKILSSTAYANALTLGELSSLSWIESPLKQEFKELVEVQYASLNFRDVMLASGKLVQDALTEKTARSDCVLGLEFSGKFQGKRICGMGTSECLATRIDPSSLVIIDIPDTWTYEEAATIPCVYATVYIALILRGKMQPGESVLIHAGSGGVGQAAIQVALTMGCRVFATVSTQEKRDFLKSRFPALTDECFANSRDAKDFESHIQFHTQGRGVDLVLNCLAQDKLYASIRCLGINGRFLEIGKFDVFNDTKIGMSILSKGVSVFGILADQMFERGRSEDVNAMKGYLRDGMFSGQIRPLSYHVFEHGQVEDAFRFMAQGKHMGKVLIQVRQDDKVPASVPSCPRTYFNTEKSYVIIGGLGGMGFELANWMVERRARNIVLSSRSGKTSTYHEYHIGVWKRRGVRIILDKSDVATAEGTRVLLQNAQNLGPVGGIFNVAVVLKDALFQNQSQADFEDVVKCKADATIHLDALSRQMAPQLDHFVVFSSIVAARGNPGQTNYAYANSVMERICERRKADGLPALGVQWGAVGDVGVFHRTMKDKAVIGLMPQSLKSCLETLDICLQQERTIVSSYVPFQRKDIGSVDPSESLVAIAANILGIKDVAKVNHSTPLVDLGMDSLMAAELAQALQSRANVQLSQKAYTQLTFQKIAEIDANGDMQPEENIDGSEARAMMGKILALRKVSENAVFEMRSSATSEEAIFIVHPMDGTVVMLEELVSQLNATVYGIECVKEAPLESMEKLAAYYIQKMKEVKPKGSYKLAGYSFGGSVAFEMALQLEKQNETVSLLLLLDASPRWKHFIQNTEGGEALRQEWENKLLSGYLMQYKSNLSACSRTELTQLKTLDDKLNFVITLLHEEYPDVSKEEIKASIASFVARAECVTSYEPRGKVKAKTILLKALKTDVGKEVTYDYGLSDICENNVEVIGIEGNHYCFYENPAELGIPAILNKVIL